jgi:HEAT repeat protein
MTRRVRCSPVRPTPAVIARLSLCSLALIGVGSLFAPPVLGQSQTGQTVVAVSEETALIAQGWAALAAGDALTASARAQQILGKYPQSVAALALGVEADIARGGAKAGLNTYELWLGARKLEEPYIIRRVAFAWLRESMLLSEARPRLTALKALAAEGDAQALQKLTDAINRGQLAETRVMAELGNENAVRAIIKQMESGPSGSKLAFIDALAGTRSRLAVPALTKLLDDPDIFVLAAATDALGKIGAPEVIVRLRPLVDEGRPGPVRWAAARALARMRDAAGTLFLRRQLVSEEADMLQIQAAEALSALGPNPDWIDTARRLATSREPQVRLYAAKVIAAYDQALAKDALESLLVDPNPAIREEATDVLAGRVAGDFATLRRLLRLSDAYAQVLAAARIVELTR